MVYKAYIYTCMQLTPISLGSKFFSHKHYFHTYYGSHSLSKVLNISPQQDYLIDMQECAVLLNAIGIKDEMMMRQGHSTAARDVFLFWP